MLNLWTLRILGAGGFGAAGWRLGALVSELVQGREQYLPWGLALTAAGVVFGAAATPWLTVKPLGKAAEKVRSAPGPSLLAGAVGMLVGLLAALLISIPLYSLEGWMGWGIPVMISVFLGLTGLWLAPTGNATCGPCCPRWGKLCRGRPMDATAGYWWTPAPLSTGASPTSA